MLPMNRLKMSNKKRVSLRTFKSYKNTRYGARDGTRTHTALPHAPQTCLSTIPTLSQTCLDIISNILPFVKCFSKKRTPPESVPLFLPAAIFPSLAQNQSRAGQEHTQHSQEGRGILAGLGQGFLRQNG